MDAGRFRHNLGKGPGLQDHCLMPKNSLYLPYCERFRLILGAFCFFHVTDEASFPLSVSTFFKYLRNDRTLPTGLG
jgi:hypothetical protein